MVTMNNSPNKGIERDPTMESSTLLANLQSRINRDNKLFIWAVAKAITQNLGPSKYQGHPFFSVPRLLAATRLVPLSSL